MSWMYDFRILCIRKNISILIMHAMVISCYVAFYAGTRMCKDGLLRC